MNTVEFLEWLWPSKGIYVLETGPHPVKNKPGELTHWPRWFNSSAAAAAYVLQKRETTNVYCALHSFGAFSQREEGNDKTRRFVKRTQENAAWTQVFYCDLDINKPEQNDPKKYAAIEEALADLKRFCGEVGLPVPTIISSGWGFHVYWRVADDMASKDWLPYAKKLKRLMAHHGLKADTVVTADPARVLRPLQSINHKVAGEPRLVSIMKMGLITPNAVLMALIDMAARKLPDGEVRDMSAEPLVVSTGTAVPPEMPENVDRVRGMLEKLSPEVGRDDWRKVVWGVASLGWSCGRDLARDWSAPGATFTEGAFAVMWDSFDSGRAGGVTWRTLEHLAIAAGYVGANLTEAVPAGSDGRRERLQEFVALLTEHKYVHLTTGERWPAASVDGRLPRVIVTGPGGEPKSVRPSAWLDENQAVAQVTWHPGEPQMIRGRVSREGELVSAPGSDCLNLYTPPMADDGGDADAAGRWLDLVRFVYPDEADHLVAWMAHRVQRPGEKINHAIVLGGVQGIGKDTIMQPLVEAVGPWNVTEIAPAALLGQFNTYVKSVVLRISEVHDLGDMTRQQFYERCKTLTTAPPIALRVNEKHRTEYHIRNCCGVVMTTNHKTDGVYLPADDRRHYVAWSTRTREDFSAAFWTDLQRWYAGGGLAHVAVYLRAYDLSGFDAKAPPRKTPAFWEIVDAGRAPEDAELAGVVERLGAPSALTMKQLLDVAATTGEDVELCEWLRRNRRAIPHRLAQCGYTHVRNAAAKDGVWKVGGRGVPIYARHDLPEADRQRAAVSLTVAESVPRRPVLRAVE